MTSTPALSCPSFPEVPQPRPLGQSQEAGEASQPQTCFWMSSRGDGCGSRLWTGEQTAVRMVPGFEP